MNKIIGAFLDGFVPGRLQRRLHEHEFYWEKLAKLLKNGGMADPAFIIGQVSALVGQPLAAILPPAQAYFEVCRLSLELDDKLMSAFGADPDKPDTWPAGDFGYDPYDSSFELHGTRNDFAPTNVMLDNCWTLGFNRGWICYQDGTEVYVTGHQVSERKPSRRPSDSNGGREMRKLRLRLEEANGKLKQIEEGDPDCDCQHDDENCCAVVGEFCCKCIAHNPSTKE